MTLLKFKASTFDIAILQQYALIKDDSGEQQQECYEDRQQTLKVIKSSEILIIIVDI